MMLKQEQSWRLRAQKTPAPAPHKICCMPKNGEQDNGTDLGSAKHCVALASCQGTKSDAKIEGVLYAGDGECLDCR